MTMIATLTNGQAVLIDKTLSQTIDAIQGGNVIEARSKAVHEEDRKELFVYAAHIVHFRELKQP